MKYKFLRLVRGKIKSDSGNTIWKIGEWQKQDGNIKLCENGFHCSKEPYDAFTYVQGEILAIVETRGKKDIQKDKEAWSEMRIVKAYKWDKKASLKLAIFSAELVLENFEKEYPNDKRPREAIEAAKKVLFKDTAKNRAAAWSAGSAARSAENAVWIAAESASESAAWIAVWSAENAAWSASESAAESAWIAAWSAAEIARSAARSAAEIARGAAWIAARSAAFKKIQTHFKKIIKELEEV